MRQVLLTKLELQVISKFWEILSEKGHHLKVGAPSIGRSFSFPDLDSVDEELEVFISVRRRSLGQRTSSGEPREAR